VANLTFLVEQLSILTTDGEIKKFKLNWAQKEYIAEVERQLEYNGRVRIIVLKARQLGISTVTEALLFILCFMYDNYRALVIAHEVEASQNLLAMTKRYWTTYPYNKLYTTEYQGKNHLQWLETQSQIGVATAGNTAVGRSATFRGVHASEVAFWPNPELVMGGLRQTLHAKPGSVLVLESTANGMGNYFHNTWMKAEAGDSEFVPLFFPWHRHPEYTATAIGIPFSGMGELDEEEKHLREMGISDDRLMWRRYAIRDLCGGDVNLFKQEYPATPMEAFIASGTNVFPQGDLQVCYKPEPGYKGLLHEDSAGVHFKPASDGPLTIFKAPSKDAEYGQYYVAGDPTRSTRGDFAVAQVINRRTLEQVAEWRGRIDPVSFADVLFLLGHYYHTAWVSTEIEGPGYSTIGALLNKNYPKLYRKQRPDTTPGKMNGEQYGWSTTMQSKNLMIGIMLRSIVDHSLTIHSQTLFNEASNYVDLGNGTYGPANEVKSAKGGGGVKGYDDTVMAMAQALTCHQFEAPMEVYTGMSEMMARNDVTDGVVDKAPWEDW